MVVHPLRFRLAHRAFAAFRAICFRRLAESVFIRTFADFRPNMAKYSDSFLSIIARLYTLPLSISSSSQAPYQDTNARMSRRTNAGFRSRSPPKIDVAGSGVTVARTLDWDWGGLPIHTETPFLAP
jgi:hypothetical protein